MPQNERDDRLRRPFPAEQGGGKRVAANVIDRLVGEVPTVNSLQLLAVETLRLDQQASIFGAVRNVIPNPERFLLELSIAKRELDSRYEKRDDPYFIDPLIHMVMRGHRIAVIYEDPDSGVSRHQARFLNKLVDSGSAVVVNSEDPDVIALDVGSRTEAMGLQIDQPLRALEDPPIPIIGPIAQSNARGLQGLFELYLGGDKHPAFKTGKEAGEAIRAMTAGEYELKMIIGTVTTPPGPDTEGVMTLDDGTEIETVNVRSVAIIGIDEKVFLERGKKEAYLHRPVRIWFNGRWETGEIAGFDHFGILKVRCDQKISDRVDFMDGHRLTVKEGSVDIDLSDPSGPEKNHPMKDYPHIRLDTCIRLVDLEGNLAYGVISNYQPDIKLINASTPIGMENLFFDDDFEVIDTKDEKTPDELTKKGNTFKVHGQRSDSDRIFEIKGVDPENGVLIGEMVSLLPRHTSPVQVFNRSEVELMGDPTEVLERYPYLKGDMSLRKVLVHFRYEGEILTGKVRTVKTLPAFVEVLVKRDPPPKDWTADVYHRFNVKVEDLIGPVEEESKQ